MAEPGMWEKFSQFKNKLLNNEPTEGEEREATHRTGKKVRIVRTGGKWRDTDNQREYVYHPMTDTVDEVGQAD